MFSQKYLILPVFAKISAKTIQIQIFASTANFFKLPHAFASAFCENKFSSEMCQNLCYQNIFTKTVHLFHMMLTSLVFFVINLRQVNILVIFCENYRRYFLRISPPFSYIFAYKIFAKMLKLFLKKCDNENFCLNTNTTLVPA